MQIVETSSSVTNVVQGIQLFVTIIGFLIVIFKGGAYVGKNQEALNNSARDRENLRNLIVNHATDDDKHFDGVDEKLDDIQHEINEVKVSVARLNHG